MRILLALFLVASVTLSACTELDLTPNPVEVSGMENSVQVGDVLIGSQPSVEALTQLADDGYKVIVSTRAAGEISWDEQAIVDSLGMRFVSIPIPSPVTGITDEQIEQLGDVLDMGDGPVVLHCGSGNRVSGLWAAWLVEEKGISTEKALSVAEQTGMTRVRPFVEQRLGIVSESQ